MVRASKRKSKKSAEPTNPDAIRLSSEQSIRKALEEQGTQPENQPTVRSCLLNIFDINLKHTIINTKLGYTGRRNIKSTT